MVPTCRAVVLAGALLLASAGVGAAQQVPGATYSGTYVPSNGGFTLEVTRDGSAVASVSVLSVPGKMIVGTCSADLTLPGPLPIVGGHFGGSSDAVSISGTFSPSRPGYVEGSVEIHSHSFLGASARQVDPTKRDPHDECNVNVKLDWNARARGDVAPVALVAPALAPTAEPTVTPVVPTPTPLPSAPEPTTPTPAPPATAEPAPAVSPVVVPVCTASAFAFGFAALKQTLGAIMGEPAECERQDAGSGDTLQATTTGLAVYRLGTNTPTFTDGSTHWALTDAGLVSWSGPSLDPPETP